MGEVNAYKCRIKVQGVEVATGSSVLGIYLCSKVCLSSDWGKYARRGVSCIGGKS